MGKHEGILDHRNWEEVKQNLQVKTKWRPVWKPPTHRPVHRIFRTLRSIFWPVPERQEKLRRTAYLDGLRGFAAFLVYWHHHHLWAHTLEQKGILENGFGVDGKYRFAALPVVRHFFSGGHFAVATFFVISGYVLSAKPLALIQAREPEKLGDNLASALFRRWLRLYMPLFATTFLFMCTWHGLGLWCYGFKPQSNFHDEVWNFYAHFKNFSFIFNTGDEPWFSYHYHSWSIPTEFRGSIVIYSIQLAFSRCTKNTRLWCSVGLVVYFLYVADAWYCALFTAGMLLCDLDLLLAKNDLPRWITRLEPAKMFIFYHMLAISMYLGGVPSRTWDLKDLRQTRGWYYLSFLKPQAVFDYKWFYLFWAATFFVATIPRIKWLKSCFETRFCQHLGRISFALYLVHGPVIWTLGDRIYSAVGMYKSPQVENIPQWVNKFPLSQKGPMGLEFSFLIPQIVLLPVTFWIAELVTRLFDEPSVKFGQWIYRKALQTSTKA